MPPPPDRAFRELVAPYERALRVHCYRMLGSSHDSDDVLQETWMRAWRSRESLKDPAAAKPWLYRIATNACLDELARRPRRMLASEDAGKAWKGELPLPPPSVEEPVWLEPLPSAWLDPEASTELKESVALAFVAALQALSAPQRAVLVLRDVVGFSAEETAEALEMTVAAANSALHRARTAVEERLAGRAVASEPFDEELLRRYVRAWEKADLDALVALLHDGIVTTMPPHAIWLDGKTATVDFFRRRLFPELHDGMMRLARADANGCVAFAVYQPAKDGPGRELHAIQVLVPRGGLVGEIHHFMTRETLAAFGAFGVPLRTGG
jgi:RNA polymerase sigma-70 factor (ECF subfamily)